MSDRKEWFTTWFNSPYYPILYNNRNLKEAAKFVDNLMAYLAPKPGSRILDIACGEGRFAKQLANYHHEVIGIDIAETGIDNARKMETDSLQFFVHDMRFPFYINYFDYAFNFFTSFGYFDENRSNLLAAKSFAAGLKTGGILVIDYLNKTKAIHDLIPKETVEKEGYHFELTKYVQNNKIVKEIDFLDLEGEKHHFKERVSAFGLEEFQSLFLKAGMKLQTTFGDYELKQFDENNSPRLIMIFKKL